MGCTNRPINELDAAMTRPGRLEIHVELGLPDEVISTHVIAQYLMEFTGIEITADSALR